MNLQPMTLILLALALLAGIASVIALLRLRLEENAADRLRKWQFSLTGLCIIACGSLYLYRATSSGNWQPTASHLDGLLLLSTLFAGMVLFIQRSIIRGLSAFSLPLYTLLLIWATYVSSQTEEPFALQPFWLGIHQASVYLGSIFICLSAAIGGMYLYVQHQLHAKQPLSIATRFASLEAIENANIKSATMGFALLTLGLVTGVLIIGTQQSTHLGPQWWSQPKILLSACVWLVFALLMNVRFASRFRGARAAWLSVVGLILLIATFGSVKMLSHTPHPLTKKMVTHLPAKPSHALQAWAAPSAQPYHQHTQSRGAPR